MRSPNVMRWLSARSGLWARRYPVKAFYFAKGGGNSIASGTAVSAGKYTARVGEEVLPAGRPGAAAKLRFALDSPLEEAVSSEPVSVFGHSLGSRVKYREFDVCRRIGLLLGSKRGGFGEFDG